MPHERLCVWRIKYMNSKIGELLPPTRLMLTPGPSNLHPRVYRAMATPLVGHLDPWFMEMMGDVQVMLRDVFQTQNRTTFPISASGSGGIEAAMLNPLEEGDEAIICVNGSFSERMAIIAERTPAKIIRVEAPYGRAVDLDDVRRAGKGKKIKLVGLAHGESSTSVASRLPDFRKVADELGALLVVDAVSTLAGMPVDVDGTNIDICFSGSQKALSAPPGMSPITLNARAEEVLRSRKTKVQSWYFDLTTTMNYWGKERTYHHTAPISLVFALREALRIVLEEGLEARWERHKQNQQALVAGLEAMGLAVVRCESGRPHDYRDRHSRSAGRGRPQSAHVNCSMNSTLKSAADLDPLKGKLWRVGLMGHNSQRGNVLLFLGAIEKILLEHGFKASPGAGVGAAVQSYLQSQAVAAGGRK